MGDATGIEWTDALRNRFWSYVAKGDGCWLWVGGIFTRGYGQFRAGTRKVRAHRASYELHFGSVPAEAIVCYRCDVPLCVRPDHLFAGSHADNARDRDAKGRGRFHPPPGRAGERNPAAKVSRATVELIRALAANGESHRGIADRVGLSQSQIGNIVNRRSWA